MKNLTWRCEICKEERPDEKISVITYSLKNLLGGQRNLKYCNDKEECLNKAKEKSKTEEI